MYAYSPMVSSILPLLIHEGTQCRYDGLMAPSKMLGNELSEQMAYGMQLSVICSEDADGLKDDPDMDSSLLGNSLVAGLVEQCRSEEHTSEIQSLMRISYAVFCLKKNKTRKQTNAITPTSQRI